MVVCLCEHSVAHEVASAEILMAAELLELLELLEGSHEGLKVAVDVSDDSDSGWHEGRL